MVKINVFIKDKFVNANDFSTDSVLTYLALRKIMRKGCDEYFVSLGFLSYELSGKQVAHKTITASILSGISELLNGGIIRQVDSGLKKKKDSWLWI